jgi:hypothetical protein
VVISYEVSLNLNTGPYFLQAVNAGFSRFDRKPEQEPELWQPHNVNTLAKINMT